MDYANKQFSELKQEELLFVEGGKLDTVSDWLLMGGSVCACFVSPGLGVTLTIITAIWA